MDPVEELYHKTLSSLRFMIKFDELQFNQSKPVSKKFQNAELKALFTTAFDHSMAEHTKNSNECFVGSWLGAQVHLK
jgi:hypothetical protein